MTENKRPASAIYAGMEETQTLPEPTGAEGHDGAASSEPAGKTSSTGAKIALAVVAVVSVVIIAVSAFALAGGFAPAQQDAGTVTAGQASAEKGGSSDSGDTSASEEAQSGSDEGIAGGEDGAEEPGGLSSDDASGSGSAGDGPSSNADSASSSSGAASDGSGSQAAASDQTKPASITVSVSVDSSASGTAVSYAATVTLEEGATVYDALVESGIPYNARSSQYGYYVDAIGGVEENHGGTSGGWTYYVNGSYINASCSSTVLHEGDSVQWVYVLVE